MSKVGEFIKQVKDKNSHVRLMGFGHRVYKNYDPRHREVAAFRLIAKMPTITAMAYKYNTG